MIDHVYVCPDCDEVWTCEPYYPADSLHAHVAPETLDDCYGRPVRRVLLPAGPDAPASSAGDGDVHLWFGLTYSNYLVWPRSLMQSMPEDWQRRFYQLANEWDEHWWNRPDLFPETYNVTCRAASGKFVAHPAPHYNRGRTFVPKDKPDAAALAALEATP